MGGSLDAAFAATTHRRFWRRDYRRKIYFKMARILRSYHVETGIRSVRTDFRRAVLPLGEFQSRMPIKKTLQAFLSPQRLRELAGPKVYARGEEYLANDHVQPHEHSRDEAIAEVMGSQPYRVELKLTSQGLTADCTCPAMSDYGFCNMRSRLASI